jgi:predicted Zn-dependent peptidase
MTSHTRPRADRSRLPEPGPDRPFRFPHIGRYVLANGLAVCAVSHNSVPIVSMVLLVPGGSSADPGAHPGLASLTADLLDEGSRGQSALEVSDRLGRLGADLDVEVGPDATVVGLTALDRYFDAGLELVYEMVTTPNLASADFERVRDLRLERLRQLRDHAPALADRAFQSVLYGSHPYAHAGSGTYASVSALTVEDVRRFHAGMFQPAGATLVIVGDRSEDALMDVAARIFSQWRPGGTPPADRSAAQQPPPFAPSSRLAVVAKPSAAQTEIRIGHVAATRATPDYHAIVLLNTILGGQFVSRLNMNLREDKGYTYGARSGFDLRRGMGPFVLQTSVGTDVTAAAVREAHAEVRSLLDDRPPTTDELALAKASLSLGYPRGFETAQQVARSVAQLALHDLPDTWFEAFVPRITAVTLDELVVAAPKYLIPDRMATVLVGDLEKIGDTLPALGLGAATVLAPEI